jgi:TetR/AcrR family transcriptional regulator, fatty acid metabolism regulator protein
MPLNGKTRHEVLAEFRNAEILEAAHKIFAQRGFSGTSVEAIAQEAGVAKGTVYLYYSSKQEIYWAALKNGLMALCGELKMQIETAGAAEDKLRAYIATKLLFFEQHGDFFKIYHAEFGNAVAHSIHKDFADLIFEQIRMIKAILSEGLKQRKIRRTKLESAAFVIFDVTRGAITQRLLGYSQMCIQEEIDFLYDFIWKGIACQ